MSRGRPSVQTPGLQLQPHRPPSSIAPKYPTPQTTTAATTSKRPRFHDDIDPDLLAASSFAKKARKQVTPNNESARFTPLFTAAENRVSTRTQPQPSKSISATKTATPCLETRLGSSPFSIRKNNEPSDPVPTIASGGEKQTQLKALTPGPQSELRRPPLPSSSTDKSTTKRHFQFEIDPDLLTLAPPVRKPLGRFNAPQRTLQSPSFAVDTRVSTATPTSNPKANKASPAAATNKPATTSRYGIISASPPPPPSSQQQHLQPNSFPRSTVRTPAPQKTATSSRYKTIPASPLSLQSSQHPRPQFTDPFKSARQRVSYAKKSTAYEIIPESSSPPPSGQPPHPHSNATPPPFDLAKAVPQRITQQQQQKRAAPITPSPKSPVDSIEDPESNSPLKQSRPKRQKIHDEVDIEIDPDSEPEAARPRYRVPVAPKRFDDISTSGDEITDPDVMDVDASEKPPTSQVPKSRPVGLTSKRFLFKTSKPTTQPPTPPGHINVRKHHKNLIPRTPTPPPGSPPVPKSWFVPKGLAETTRSWKEKAYGSMAFRSETSSKPPPKSFRITVQEFMKDEKMVIIRGFGESGTGPEGIVKAMLTGKAADSIKKVGCMVRYGKPWLPVNLFGEDEPYRCLIGPYDVVEPKDRDVHMTG